jgi:hypothetical protein
MKIVFVIEHSPLMGLKNDGMTFFEQTVYCIELFIQRRIQLGFFGGDKYFLYGIQQNN